MPASENKPFDNNDNLAAFTRDYVQTDTLASHLPIKRALDGLFSAPESGHTCSCPKPGFPLQRPI